MLVNAFFVALSHLHVRWENKRYVLAEKKRTNSWLASELGENPATVSKWCTNSSQPDLPTLKKVAELLEVDVKDLLWSTKE